LPQTLSQKIAEKTVRIGVVGMGYVGLPLARAFCANQCTVIGFDVDDKKVDSLNRGRSYIAHIPSEELKRFRSENRFEATSDMARLKDVDAILIAVPTPLTPTKDPDLRYVRMTAESVSATLRKNQLVVLESTTFPGTTREVVQPILERSGLKAGKDFYLAYSPEREDPGRTTHRTEEIPKLVGGINRTSCNLAAKLYRLAIREVHPVNSCEVAEAAKILENVYRSVNIALVNEMKMTLQAMNVNVWDVIDAASTKPFGFQAFYPGPGLGGHCIPIDPFYLSFKAREFGLPCHFIRLAGEINTAMPEYVVNRISEALNVEKKAINGARILILGLAYKKNVDDIRESPSIVLIEKLRERGAKVDYNDPHVTTTHPQREHDLKMRSKPLSARMLKSYDCTVIATDHSDYDYDWIVRHSRLVVDTRNATKDASDGREKIWQA
jgi:UDP-N-acetyl-D-glucosamine dehydrogenase